MDPEAPNVASTSAPDGIQTSDDNDDFWDKTAMPDTSGDCRKETRDGRFKHTLGESGNSEGTIGGLKQRQEGSVGAQTLDDCQPSQSSSHGSRTSSQSILDGVSDALSLSTPELDDEYRDIDQENKQKFHLLQEFFSVLSNGDLEIHYKWQKQSVSEKVDRSRAKLLDTMVQYLLETIFPGADQTSYQDIINRAFNPKIDNSNCIVLDKIIEAYQNTQSKEVKKYLIMELTLVKKFKDLQDILPGLTMYQYKAAKQNVKDFGLTKIPDLGYQSVTRNRRDYDSTVYFVNFFTSFIRVCISYQMRCIYWNIAYISTYYEDKN